ncbi:Glutamate receptor delta-2 subunit [Dufourea novaeangliae]|uniref:Glutamate receptor delta-2 subunit n=1 Tax=Dufourea novaeangliae TaxID=178035 RepID=A0A154PG70_DUFNO|nr:Glutamate receptor delta-2 subunit [Dufourea novaeangliae]
MKRTLTLYVIEIFLLPVFGRKADLFVPESKSWISDDGFRIVLKLSFPFSTCCNVLLNDPIEDSMALFSQFRSVYPYEYLLKRSDQKCDGYLLLGSSEKGILRLMKKISPLSWKTEILVIVNNETSDDSDVFNDSSYGMANVNIVSMSGIWKLTENYLKPRGFNKIDRYEEMLHNYDEIDLRGRNLQVYSINRPPMTFLTRTIKKSIDGEQAEVYVMDDYFGWDGIEMQLFLIMADKLNFTWTLRKPDGNYTFGVKINDTMWEGGVIGMVFKNKADIAFGSIWVTYEQNKFIQLSDPWFEVCMHFLVPRPRRRTNFWALTRPFSEEIWELLLLAIILHSLYAYARAWIDPKFPKRFRNFVTTLTELIGWFLNSSVPRTITSNKLQILLWQIAGWLIIAAYCSSLASRLATVEYQNRIDTVEQFLAANLSWGSVGQVPPFHDYFDFTDQSTAQLPRRYQHLENITEWEMWLKNDGHAVLGKIIDTTFFPNDYVPNDYLKNYRVMMNPVGSFHIAFGLQPWLLVPINRIMMRLKETGIVSWQLRDVIRRRDSYNLREVLVEHDRYDGAVQVLGLTPLGAGFSLLFVGFSAATFVFYMELRHTAGSRNIFHVLRTINSKRRSMNKRNAPSPKVCKPDIDLKKCRLNSLDYTNLSDKGRGEFKKRIFSTRNELFNE